MWQILHLHACLHDTLYNGMHAYLAHNATVCMPVLQTKHSLHASVADTTCVAEYTTACIHV